MNGTLKSPIYMHIYFIDRFKNENKHKKFPVLRTVLYWQSLKMELNIILHLEDLDLSCCWQHVLVLIVLPTLLTWFKPNTEQRCIKVHTSPPTLLHLIVSKCAKADLQLSSNTFSIVFFFSMIWSFLLILLHIF